MKPKTGRQISVSVNIFEVKPKMKAYYAQYKGEDWVTVVHGETRGKAKWRFAKVDPSGEYDPSRWNEIRLTRIPYWDDMGFIPDDQYNQLFTPDEYDKDGYPVYHKKWIDCDCELCKGEKR